MKRILTIKPADYASFFWGVLAVFIASLVLVPLGGIVWLGWSLRDQDMITLAMLGGLFFNTISLMGGAVLGSLILGAVSAWFVVSFQFFGRAVLTWALILPLALPAYILAYVYADLLTYSGPVQTSLRILFGYTSAQDYYFPDIRSLGGAVLVLSFALYPYVYIAAHSVFARRSALAVQAARSLGASEWGSFFKMALPLARPALAASLMLVLMECLNDIGVVEYFGVRTLTLGLYDVWLNRDNLAGAVQIALLMMLFAFGLIALERFLRRQQSYALDPSSRDRGMQVHGVKHGLIFVFCALPPLLGFVLPMALLAWMSYEQANVIGIELAKVWTYARQSLALASSAAVLVTGCGLLLSYAHRIVHSQTLHYVSGLAVMGYALPGAVLGLGIILILVQLQNLSNADLHYAFVTGYKVLLFAYFVRFLALPYGLVGSGLARIKPQLDAMARILGLRVSEMFRQIHLPLLRPAIWGGIVLVFVETMRELPLTLIVRPFNFETLATYIYTIASLGFLEEIALAALVLGLIGLLPAFLWVQAIGGVQRRSAFL